MRSRSLLQSITLVFALALLLAALIQADAIEARATKKTISTKKTTSTKKQSSHKPKTTTTSSTKSAHKSKTTQSKSSSKTTKKASTKAISSTSKATSSRSKATTSATSTHKSLTTQSKKTTKTTAKSSTKATSTDAEATSVPPLLEDDSDAAAKAAQDDSASSVFCKTFVKQCFTEALKGQTGNVVVAHSCQRNGKKDSTSYTYSCKRGKTDLVSKVLNALGKQYTVLTTVGKTTIVTGTTTAVQTAYAVETATVLTEISKTTVSESKTDFSLVPTATTVLTTEIPYTTTGTTTSIATETSTSTEIVVSGTTTSTAVFLGTDGVPVENVQVCDNLGQRRRDVSDFCSAFTHACETQCNGNSSKVKNTVCKAQEKQKYTLACVCKNGDLLTQHALAAVVQEQYISSIATLQKSTAWLTTTRTTTISGATPSTRFVTLTTTMPTTKTFTKLATSTIASTLTEYTGKSAAAETLDVTVATTTTVTTPSVTSIKATVTTQIVLASTGYAHATAVADGSDQGYVAANPSGWARLTAQDPDLEPQNLMAIRDANTGLYQLAAFGEPNTVLVTESGYRSFSTDAKAFGYMYFADKSLCGTAGSAAGASAAGPGSHGNPCETFLFRPIADDGTFTSGSALLQGSWVNADSSIQQTEWIYYDDGEESSIYQVADAAAFAKAVGSTNVPFNMIFPDPVPGYCRRQENLERSC